MTLNKKRIAKEIIYLFSSLILLALIWGGIEIRDSYIEKNLTELRERLDVLVFKIDSIENTYPKKAKSFAEIMQIEKISKWDKYIVSDSFVPDNDLPVFKKGGFIAPESDLIPPPPPKYLYDLYSYLSENNFDFSIPNQVPLPKGIKLTFDSFEMEIYDAFGFIETEWVPPSDAKRVVSTPIKNAFLIKMHSFLKNKNEKFLSDTNAFYSFLQGMPEPPRHEVYELAENLKKQKSETQTKILDAGYENLNSDEKKTKMINISLVVLGVLYPLRFIVLLLIWAVKTVRS